MSQFTPQHLSAEARARTMSPATLYRAVLLAFALVVSVLVFPHIVGLLLLILLVAVVAVPLSRAADWLQRFHVPRGVGAPLTLLAFLAVLAGVIVLLVPSFAKEGDRLVNSLPGIIDSLRHQISNATHTSPSKTGQDIQRFITNFTQHPQKLLGPATAIGAGIAGFITSLVVVLLTAIYTAIQPHPLVNGALRLVPRARRSDAQHILSRLAEAYTGWLRGLAVGMLVLGVITYLGLLAVGLPYAIVFATLTALAMVVPYFGALASMIPPVLVALTISPSKALIVAGIYLVAHQVEGNLIGPIVMARAVKLHPALVAIGVVGVERLFGFAGLFVAVPILVTFKILIEELWMNRLDSTAESTASSMTDTGGATASSVDPSPAALTRAPR